MHIGRSQLFVAVVALASGGGALALGFGPVRSSVTLGQPLNIAVPVNLAEGETLSADCASAEITAGEIRVPPSAVRVRVTQGRDVGESVLRITTTTVVDEPVLTVVIGAGCPTRLTRELVLLADPPLVITASADTAPVSPRAATVAPSPAAPAAAAAPASPAPATAATPPRSRRPAPPPRATTRTVRAPAPQAVAAAAPVAASAPAPAATRAAAASAPARSPARTEAKPRLQLEAGQISTNQLALLAAQQQASAAQATASAAEAAASSAAERMRSMESEVTRLRADAKAQTDALLQLRQQLALDRAEREKPSPLIALMLGLLAALAALAAWFGWRLRKQAQMPNRQDWWDRNAAATAAAPRRGDSQLSEFKESRLPPPVPMPSAPAPWSGAPTTIHSGFDSLLSPATLPAPTQVTIPPLPSRDEEGSRAVSVDEQIDLEQQADFFIALGHDDAAIDLLMAHLRSTGGGIPLPYLKLLEIHRRLGQREAYERTRVRFNQRFNSVAPDWDTDPLSGHSLDNYPLVIGRIQRAWPAPLDAMAELEAMLFRRGEEAELFDLPAYQELLFLYTIARDLHQSGNATGVEDVDVLLPIGGRSAPIASPEGTIMLRPEFNAGEPLSLDLDLAAVHDEALPAAAAAEPPPFSLEQIESPRPGEPDEDLWGRDPDARTTR